MSKTNNGKNATRGRYDHSLLLWAILLGGGVLAATLLGYLPQEWGISFAVLFGLGFLILYLLSPALSREKLLTRAGNQISDVDSEPDQTNPSAHTENDAHPLTQSTPVLILDDQQLLEFISQNPQPLTHQFADSLRQSDKKDSDKND